jgi:EmrB/QacA subfamily drug resistance transporter
MALAIGPLVGGILTQKISWSWIFFINVPIGVVAVVAARLFVDESRDTSRVQRLDLPGLVSSAVGLFALTYALISTNHHSWTSPRVLGLFALSAVSLGIFVLLELHQRYPMLDLSLFRDSTFAGANTVMLMIGLAMFGIFFFNSLFIQNILGYSAIQTGATFLPMTVLIILVAPQAGRLSDRLGSRWLVGVGMALLTVSLLVFSTLDAGSSFWNILPGLILGGFGMGLTMTPVTAAAMGSVPVAKAGVGSAVINSMRQVGGSLGIAIMGAVVATQIRANVSDPRDAFVVGYHHALYVGAGICLAGAALAVATIRQIPHREPARAPEPAIGADF